MIKYREETVSKPYFLNKIGLLQLEELIFKNLPTPNVCLYDVYASIENIEVGPEFYMEDFVEIEGLFEALKQAKDYYITISYIDKNFQIYLKLASEITILNLKGPDNDWVNGMKSQIEEFLESNGQDIFNSDSAQNPDEPLPQIVSRKPKEPNNTGRNCLAMLISMIIVLAAIAVSLYLFFYRF